MTTYTITKTELDTILFTLNEMVDLLMPDGCQRHGIAMRMLMRMLQSLTPADTEPVAWITPRMVDSFMRTDLGYETCEKNDYAALPVYTHPAPLGELTPVDMEPDGDHLTIAYLDGYQKGRDARLRELSDDDIEEVYLKVYNEGFHGRNLENAFARAILKAAREVK